MKPMTPTRSMMIWGTALAFALAGCNDSSPDQGAPPSASVPAAGAAEAALTEALAGSDPYARAARLGELLPTLGAEAIPDVRATIEHFRLDLGAAEFELLLRFWATHDPEAATNWAFKKAGFLYRAPAARTTIEVWAQQDPEGAVAAAETALAEAGEDVVSVAEVALVRGWFQKDRDAVLRYIESLGSGIKRQRSLYAYALALAGAEGSDAVIRWGESVSDEDLRYKLEVYRQVLVALTWADTESAKAFCVEHCDGPYGRGLREVLIRTRLHNGDEGGDIVEWVGLVPEDSEDLIARKKHSLWVAYSVWAYDKQDEAIAWMDRHVARQEPEPWLRYLYGEYARQLAVGNPEKAIRWAEKVEDDVDRQRTMVRIVRYWMTQDPEAAGAWLAGSPLSEKDREKARDTTAETYLPGLDRP
jgi:hypothetical protein